MTLENQIHQWLDADNELKEIRTRDKELCEIKRELEEGILEMFSQAGITRMTVDGRTVHVVKSLRVSPKKTEEDQVLWRDICDTMSALGYPDYIETKVDTRRVGALIREIDNDPDQEIPPEMHSIFNIYEQYTLRSRKA